MYLSTYQLHAEGVELKIDRDLFHNYGAVFM